MPYEDNFKENTKFHSAHYFLNQFQSKDYEDSIIQLDGPSTNSPTSTSTTPVDPGLITVPIPSSSTSSTNNKRLNINSPEPFPQQQQQQQLVLTLNTDLNDYMRGINKNKKKLSNNVKDTPLSRTASTSPCLISPVFTNNESNTSPELELLEFEEDDDDDDEEDDDDEDELWDQDEIFQMHGDGFSINPTAPGLFPQMDIGTNKEFMTRDRLPIEPMVHKRQ